MTREDYEMRVREWKHGYDAGKFDGMKAAWGQLFVYIYLASLLAFFTVYLIATYL